jgi:hypothetical protein
MIQDKGMVVEGQNASDLAIETRWQLEGRGQHINMSHRIGSHGPRQIAGAFTRVSGGPLPTTGIPPLCSEPLLDLVYGVPSFLISSLSRTFGTVVCVNLPLARPRPLSTLPVGSPNFSY